MNDSVMKTPNSKMILAVLFFGWIVSYIDRTVMGLALSSIGKEMSLETTALGVVLSSFFVGYALMQIPGGWLADKFGSRRIIIIAVLFWCFFTGLSGVAWSLTSLLLIRFLFGIGEGAYPAASTKAISDYFYKDKRTKAQSTMMSSNALGGALSPIICTPLLIWLGWRHTFLAISLLGIIVIVWFLYVSRAAVRKDKEIAVKAEKGAYKELLRTPFLWQVMLIFFFSNIAGWGLSSWMPTYLIQVQGINLKSAGFAIAIPALLSALGMIVSGRMIDKIGSKVKFFVMVSTFVYAMFLYLITTATSLTEVILYQSVAMICGSFTYSFVFTLPHRFMKQNVVGTAFGMINFGGQAAGILSPTIMGLLISRSEGSYNSAFLFLTASCLMATIIALTLPKLKQQAQTESPLSLSSTPSLSAEH